MLSQYDDPEYAISLLGEGSAGYAYLLKDRLGDGDQLARAIREVAGGSLLDESIVKALINRWRRRVTSPPTRRAQSWSGRWATPATSCSAPATTTPGPSPDRPT